MKQKYESPMWIVVIGVTSFIIFWVGVFTSIWWITFRWRIFFTSLYFLIIASLLAKYDINEEKKFNLK